MSKSAIANRRKASPAKLVELGQDRFLLKRLSGAQLADYLRHEKDDADEGAKVENMARMVAMSLVEEDGSPSFETVDDAAVAEVAGMDFADLITLFKDASEINKLNESLDTTQGNLPPTS